LRTVLDVPGGYLMRYAYLCSLVIMHIL
jgi:hypothetical protein